MSVEPLNHALNIEQFIIIFCCFIVLLGAVWFVQVAVLGDCWQVSDGGACCNGRNRKDDTV